MQVLGVRSFLECGALRENGAKDCLVDNRATDLKQQLLVIVIVLSVSS